MEECVQVKADVPRDLKRRAFAALALREEKFNRWLRIQMEEWLQEVEGREGPADITEHGYADVDRVSNSLSS
jgi:hypothetical protein